MSAEPARRVSSGEKLASIIDSLEISAFQKDLLRQRWLDQVKWLSEQSRRARRRYLWLRVPVVVGGVAIPGFVTILLSGAQTVSWLGNLPIDYIRLAAFAISLGVGILAALEEVLHYGERWRHYRRTSEILKTIGWQYLMLSGLFRRYASHAAAYAAFTERVEDALNEDVEGYLGAMTGDGSNSGRQEIIA